MGRTHSGQPHREQIIQLHALKRSDQQIADELGIGTWVVRDYRHHILQLPPWSRYERMNAVRSDCSVTQHAETIRTMHAQHHSDADIALVIGVKREAVGYFRRKHLGLPVTPRQQQPNRHKGRRSQERTLGCGPEVIRAERLWQYAIDHGWPSGMRMRAAQILDLLIDGGPLTRQQIAERLQLTLKSLNSNDPQGTYLSNLISRGLVASVARAVETGRVCRDGRTRKGTQVSLYFPTPEAIAMKLAWRRTHLSKESHS